MAGKHGWYITVRNRGANYGRGRMTAQNTIAAKRERRIMAGKYNKTKPNVLTLERNPF